MEENLGSIFVNFQKGTAMCMAEIEMDYTQLPTPEVRDITTGDGFANDNIRQLRSIYTVMKLYWVRDRLRQWKFLVYLVSVEHNTADYFTKHNPTRHHLVERSTFIVHTVDFSNYT